MPIPWTDKEKKSLQPTRAFAAVAPSERSVKQLRKVFTAKSHSKERLETYRRGVSAEVEPELRPLREAALKLIEDVDLDAIKSASMDELAAAEVMFALGHGFASLTDAVVLSRGVADALAMRLRSHRFGLNSSNWTWSVYLTSAPNGRQRTGADSRFWLPLRHAICSASLEEYEAAKKVALAAWDTLDIQQKANVAYVFPDEPFGEEVLTSPEAAQPVRGAYGGMPAQVQQFGFLLSTCSNALVAKAYFDQGGSYWVSESALELSLLLPKADATTLFMDAIPQLLIKKKYQTFLKTPPRKVFNALMKLDDERVPEFVASYVGHKVLGAQAALYFQECPEDRGALKNGNASAQRLHESLGGVSASDDTKLAPKTAVPALLRSRAWRKPQGQKKMPSVRGLEVAPSQQEHVVLPDGVEPLSRGPQKLAPLEGEALQEWRESIKKGRAPVDSVYQGRDWRTRYHLPPKEALAAWNEGRGYLHDVSRFVAEHGLGCIDGFVLGNRLNYLDYEGADEWIAAYEAFHTPRMAPVWARVFSGRKKWREVARRWFRADPRRAAEGLVPAALGEKGRPQKDAVAALRDLVSAGHDEAIRGAASAHGAKAAVAMESFLARDPRIIDAKPPKLPSFLRIDQLPPILVEGGRLSDEQRAAFVELLSVAEPEYVGFGELRKELDAPSVEAFVLALVDSWARQGGPGRHDWMLRAALAFPSDKVVRAICEHARAWARSKGAAAQRACAALAYLGAEHESDAAALHLAHIAATTRFVALRREAAEHLEFVAAARGLTRDELDDRSTPDLGLDASGKLRLTFGDVAVDVQPDEQLGVVLRKDGEVIRAFPRVAKSASAEEKAAHKGAKARYDGFKKDLSAISARQIRRLENSMASGRAWSLADARRYFFDHPLARYLARGLVWLSEEGQSFRLTEDGTFADALDDEVQVAGAVRIAHVLELGDADKWSAVFADYELLQPVLQLARPTYALTKAERSRGEVTRFEGNELKAAKIMGLLESRGWRRDSTNHISEFRRTGREGAEFNLRLKSSIEMEYLSSGDKVALGTLKIVGKASVVSISEALHDLHTLCG